MWWQHLRPIDDTSRRRDCHESLPRRHPVQGFLRIWSRLSALCLDITWLTQWMIVRGKDEKREREREREGGREGDEMRWDEMRWDEMRWDVFAGFVVLGFGAKRLHIFESFWGSNSSLLKSVRHFAFLSSQPCRDFITLHNFKHGKSHQHRGSRRYGWFGSKAPLICMARRNWQGLDGVRGSGLIFRPPDSSHRHHVVLLCWRKELELRWMQTVGVVLPQRLACSGMHVPCAYHHVLCRASWIGTGRMMKFGWRTWERDMSRERHDCAHPPALASAPFDIHTRLVMDMVCTPGWLRRGYCHGTKCWFLQGATQQKLNWRYHGTMDYPAHPVWSFSGGDTCTFSSVSSNSLAHSSGFKAS